MDFTISLPDWAIEENKKLPTHISSLEERMRGRDDNVDLTSNILPSTLYFKLFALSF